MSLNNCSYRRGNVADKLSEGGLDNPTREAAMLPATGIIFDTALDESYRLGDRERKCEDDDHEGPEFLHEKMLRIKLEQFSHADNCD